MSGEMASPDAGSTPAAAEILHLTVLGSPVARWGEPAVSFRTRKEFALLVYLALARTPRPREHLATLFWPDHDAVSARNVVRTTLSRLRRHLAVAGGMPVAALTLLRAERDALGREVVGLARAGLPAVRLDVELLEAVVSPTGDAADAADGEVEARLQAAAAAYRGAFLEGVCFEDAPELEEWVGAQRAARGLRCSAPAVGAARPGTLTGTRPTPRPGPGPARIGRGSRGRRGAVRTLAAAVRSVDRGAGE